MNGLTIGSTMHFDHLAGHFPRVALDSIGGEAVAVHNIAQHCKSSGVKTAC